MKAEVAAVLLLACGSLAVSLPRWPTKSFVRCDADQGTRFLPSKSYTYRYEGTVSTGIAGTTNEKTEMKITARCVINSVSSCKYSLNMYEVLLMERDYQDRREFTVSKGSKHFATRLEDYSVTFTTSQGRIMQLKSDISEKNFATNIKRGILSAFQLEFRDEGKSTVVEKDVSGDCNTLYTKTIKDGQEEVTKVKNLTECSNRIKAVDTYMHPVFYTSNLTKRTLLEGSSSCHYKIAKSHHIKSVECEETHLLRPFSHQSAGVTTHVTKKLTLERTDVHRSYSDYLGHFIRLTDLGYESETRLPPTFRTDVSQIEKTLKDMVKDNLSKETFWESSMMYTKLVFQLKRLKLTAIDKLWTKYYMCTLDGSDFCRTNEQQRKYTQIIVDAISQCGTEPCAEFIMQLIRSTKNDPKEFQEGYMKQMISAMAWMRNPSSWILNQFMLLFKEKRNLLPKNTITILGSMVRSYCDKNPMNCGEMSGFLDEKPVAIYVMSFLRDELYVDKKLCKATPEKVDDVIYALRAIGNSQHMDTSPSKLVECALQSNYRNISAVALQVLSDFKQDYQTRKMLKQIYVDYSKDPEMRMVAYLAWMKTPTEDDVKTAVETLEGEINTQVGSFVWSHLNSTSTSVEPTNGKNIGMKIKEFLTQTKKTLRFFNTSSKSTYWHKSMFNEKWNLGMSADGHVMYHPESLLPRSSHVNVTMDILGGAFPVLESSMRMEGMERVWERLFGPQGFFPDNHINDMIKTKHDQFSNRISKRSINNEVDLDYLHDRVHMPEPSPSGLFSFKLFGNELALFMRKDLEWLEDEVPLADIVDELNQLKRGIDKTYSKSLMFMQDSFVVPTCIGLPLNVRLNGTAVGSLHVVAKGDLRSLFWGKKNINLKGIVKPSAAVSLSGMMSVNAVHSMIGIQLNSTMFTSTEIRANMTYKEGQKFKFHYDITEKPQELFNISSALFKQVNNHKTEIKGIKHRNTTSFCTSSIFNTSKYLGLDWCSNVSIPVSWYNTSTPMFPLTGPGNFSFNLRRVDPKLTTFKLEANMTTLTKYANKTCMEFSTPMATYARIFRINMTTFKKEHSYWWNMSVGDVDTPWSVFDFKSEKNSKKMYLKLNVTVANKTFHHESQYYNESKMYQFVTNTTMFNYTTGVPVAVMFLNATTLKTKKSMTFNMTHFPSKFTWKVTTAHKDDSTNISCIMKHETCNSRVLNHNMAINITYINQTSEKGFHVNITVNKTRYLTMFSSRKYIKTKEYTKMTTYLTNCTLFNRTTSFNFTMAQGFHANWSHMYIAHQNRSLLTLNTTWLKVDGIKKLAMNATFMNHSLLLQTSMKNYTKIKSICWNGTYNGSFSKMATFDSCLVFQNETKQKHLVWNTTWLNVTQKLKLTWVLRPELKMIKVNYTSKKVTRAKLTFLYRKTPMMKIFGIDGRIGTWKIDLSHTCNDTKFMRKQGRLTSVVIKHKITNGSQLFMKNSFSGVFYNTSMEKFIMLNFTFWNQSYGMNTKYNNRSTVENVWHFSKIKLFTPYKTLTWDAIFQNTSKILNVSSIVSYQKRKVLNHTIFWNKDKKTVNVTVDLLHNVTLSFNCSSMANKGMNLTLNMTAYNETMMFTGFGSKEMMLWNLTLWNRTVTFEGSTCSKSKSLFMNLSTWNYLNKTAFNGSLSWYLNATASNTSLNVTVNNASLHFTGFSHNSSHLFLSLVRRNRKKLYNDSTIEFRNDGKCYGKFNSTSLKMLWKMVNDKTFHIPTKLLNITVVSTSGGVSTMTTGKHLKLLLHKVTDELSAWNFTQQKMTENLFNLTKHILNVTSHTLPNMTANYDFYLKKDQFMMIKFCENLSMAIVNFTKSKIHTKRMTEELVWSLRKISGSFNWTAVIGSMTNTTWYNTYWKDIHKNVTWEVQYFTNYTRNMTKKMVSLLNKTSIAMGTWKFTHKNADVLMKEVIPRVSKSSMLLMDDVLDMVQYLHGMSLTWRNVTFNISEDLINITYPSVHNMIRSMKMKMKEYVNDTSFVGGIMHPVMLNLTEMFNISIFNATIHKIHQYFICDTHLESLFPIMHYPQNMSELFHKFTMKKTLEKILNVFLNKTLELYNTTLRLPSWNMNKTHEKLVYITDFVVMMLNDTMNVMDINSNKNLSEIFTMYVNHTWNITMGTWNMTKYLCMSNLSQPLKETWEKMNFNKFYSEKAGKHMPWSRPVIRMWNSTMYNFMQLVQNYSPEAALKHLAPRSIDYAMMKASDFGEYCTEKCFTYKDKKMDVKITVRNEMIDMTSTKSMVSRPNFTKMFLNVFLCFQNDVIPAFKLTKNFPLWFMKSMTNICSTSTKTLSNRVEYFLNSVRTTFDMAESLVNGTMVNTTVHKFSKFCGKMMNTSMVDLAYNYKTKMMNKSMKEVYNTSKIPFYHTWKTVKTFYQMEAHQIAHMLTPKNQTAFIVNQRHFITFDKRSFQFPEFQELDCTFLITRDFLDGHFTVLGTQSSYIIITAKTKIEVYKNGQIKASSLNSETVQTDLPLQYEDVYAIREGPFIRVMHKEKWFEFEFEMEHFNFGAFISGFYHNRTLGLLGTNNGEVSDDWRTPLGKNKTELAHFLNSWKISSDSSCFVNTPTHPLIRCRRMVTPRCEQLFVSQDSPFKKCFDSVSPSAFLQPCLEDVPSCDAAKPIQYNTHCMMARTYVKACAKEGVVITMPTDCVSCNKERYLISRSDIDVVFVTSEGTKMKPVTQKLRSFIYELDNILQQKKLFNTRYGLVGFNGNPPAHWKAHVHTLKGKFFGSSSDFYNAIDTLDFAPSLLKTNVSDGYSGIYEASKYPFHPKARRVFILVTDSPRVPDSKLNSDVIINAMRNIGGKLIVIGDYSFKEGTYGGDSDGFRFYEKIFKPIKHKNIEPLPNDDYVNVMKKTGGAVFRLKKFEGRKTEKRAFQFIIEAIAKFSEGKVCIHCRCVIDEVGKQREICKPSSKCNRK